jgi:pimeloyl-ACP methyl ester carboxylesterase
MTESADGVLLIHAFPLDAGMWERQVGTLENAGWPVAAPSLPGFGGADGVGPTMTMGAAADRCLQAADAAGIERFVACGLSMGGYVAFELWRMARQRIAGVVLANTRSGADTPEAAQGRRALADRLDAEGNGFLVEQPPPLLSDQASDELWDQVRGAIRAQPAASIGAAARGMAERIDSTPDLGAIDVPMLIVTSSLDTLIPAAVSAEMRDHHRDAGLVEIPGAGHLSNLEAPEAFDQALLAFLATFDRA